MKAIVLAAGYATRLYPYTENYPKSLLKIAGRPLIDYTMDRMVAAPAIDAIYIVTNDRYYRAFEAWALSFQEKSGVAGKSLPILEIVNDGTSCNEERLGSIGDLEFVLRTEKIDDDLLVICSDKVFTFSLSDFIDTFRQRGEAINACSDTLDRKIIAGKFGCILLDEDNRIVDFQEKPENPKSSVKSIAFYIYPRKVIPLIAKYLDRGGNRDAPGYFTEWLCKRTPMYGWSINGACDDVGNPASYLEANSKYWSHTGSAFQEVKILILVKGNLDHRQLNRVMIFLEAWDRVTLGYIAASGKMVFEIRNWMAEEPRLLPLNLLEGLESADAGANRLGCSVTIVLGGKSDSIQIDQEEMERLLDGGSKVVIQNGKVEKGTT